MTQPASILIGTKGERVALCDVSVSAALRDLLADVTVTQTYRNDEKLNIEAVYTFPLPPDAVLLDLSVTLGGRKLKGAVVEKKAAEARYEDAIADGNAAVMLEQPEPGLYTMNVGNLLPNETAVIAFTYALTYRWTGDNLRILIPTTIAPRYGASPLQPHQAPESSLTVENEFSLQVEVFGSLGDARFECPSHEVTLTPSSGMTKIALSSAKASMDRDFVLNVKAPQAAHSFAVCGADEAGAEAAGTAKEQDRAAVVALFQPVFPGLRQPRTLDLAIVIDCSGSMQGDSITQAKQALAGILDGLQHADRITIVAFGDHTKWLSGELLPCTDANLGFARSFAAVLDADMGGTEIDRALQAAYAATNNSEAADILLVTDGEVSQWERVVGDAKKSGRRIFTVGVGHAVSESFVRELAAATGGACELVSPREGMADRVVRHFERMRTPRARRVVVHWPEGARNQAPARFNTVFEGDTVFASAQFDRASVTGNVVMEIETESGQAFRQELAIGQAPAPQSGTHVSTVARLAAAARIKELDQEAAARTAVQYQLASQGTNWLVVAERPDGEKMLDIPAIRKVPNTLAAGWGGVGAMMPAASRAHVGRRMTRRLGAELTRISEMFAGPDGQLEASRSTPDDDAAREVAMREEESRLREFQSEFAVLAENADELTRHFKALTNDARAAIEPLQHQLERVLRGVTSELDTIERQAESLQRALDALAGKAPGSEHLDAIMNTRKQLESLRDRLRRMQDVLGRLARYRDLLREAEEVLQRA